jgi:hypothetical protein
MSDPQPYLLTDDEADRVMEALTERMRALAADQATPAIPEYRFRREKLRDDLALLDRLWQSLAMQRRNHAIAGVAPVGARSLPTQKR